MQLLLQRWPHGEVHLFGSVAASLSICNNNDIDVCLELSTVGDDTVGTNSQLCHASRVRQSTAAISLVYISNQARPSSFFSSRPIVTLCLMKLCPGKCCLSLA